MSTRRSTATPDPDVEPGRTVSRRHVLYFLVAAPTLAVVARGLNLADAAGIPSLPGPSDEVDLGDLQDLAAAPTSNLITVVINTDGTASFSMPRAEVGQGITTSIGMLIAEELDLPLDKVRVTLSDARPELFDNQLTGGSNTMRSMYTPVRTAAAAAREQLVAAAAAKWGVPVDGLTTVEGVVIGTTPGQTLPYGTLATLAAVQQEVGVTPTLKSPKDFRMIGTAQNRVDARDIVMGKKVFAMDLDIPGALPTMLCRPPTVRGTPKTIRNAPAVLAMPGVTHVGMLPTGVAVRARTFGQCIDAVRALQVTWNPGTEDGRSEADIKRELAAAELPMTTTALGLLAKKVDLTVTSHFGSNSPLETGTAVADVTATKAEVWSCLKAPIVAQAAIAEAVGLPVNAVTVHVVQGGGSFGRHLFHDCALEAAQASKLFKVPVRMMWSRTDDFRAGRTHPMATSHVLATYNSTSVLTFEQRHTGVSTDFSHGFGDVVTATAGKIGVANTLALAQTIFEFTANIPYNFGVTSQLLNEVDYGFNTGSLRNIYSPDVCTAIELAVDQIAAGMGKDPLAFRKAFLKDDRSRAVLQKAADVGGWGRKMPAHTAQGIAFHSEYKGVCACLVEIDCTPATVNRVVRDAVTGPRVTKVVFVVDVGLAVNPKGLEAQMQGGIMDGIGSALTNSLHFDKGQFLEGSWDNYFYTRQWNVPPVVQVIVMPTTTGNPGGAGEFGVAATKAAVACAYARATGTIPTTLPVNHDGPLGFDPLPTVPPTPQSPTNGLTYSKGTTS